MNRNEGSMWAWGGSFLLGFGGTLVLSSRLHILWSLASAAALYAALLISPLVWTLGRGFARRYIFYGVALLFGSAIGVAGVDIQHDDIYLVGIVVFLAVLVLSEARQLKHQHTLQRRELDASHTREE
jgi:hypothetical protein